MLLCSRRTHSAWLVCAQIAAQERFLDKRNYAYWVGRVQFTEEGERDRQRYILTECGRRLREIKDPRAGYISINSGGNFPITVRTCPRTARFAADSDNGTTCATTEMVSRSCCCSTIMC